MKAIFIFIFLVLVAGVVILYLSMQDIMDISSKTGPERRDAIVTKFEQQLLKLESDYFSLSREQGVGAWSRE